MTTLEPFTESNKGLNKSDTLIIRYAAAGKSPAEIEKLTNIPAAQVVLRVQSIIQNRDIWTEHERFMLYLDDLYALKTLLQNQVQSGMDSKDTTNLIRVLDQLGKALEKQSKLGSEITDKVSRKNASWMLKMIVQGFERAKELLSEKYPEVDMDIVEATFREGLTDAIADSD